MLVATGVSKVESTKNTKKNYRVKISHNKLFKRDSRFYHKILFYKFFFLDVTPWGNIEGNSGK